MQIYIKTLTGRVITIKEVCEKTTVYELKERLYDAEGLHPDVQRLIF
jgi:hypothetical protein